MGDGPMHQSGRQMINFGNRGIASFVATVYGPAKPLHDGHYGSWAPSPAVMIAELVTSLRDDDGRILIPHFYDDVAPVSARGEGGARRAAAGGSAIEDGAGPRPHHRASAPGRRLHERPRSMCAPSMRATKAPTRPTRFATDAIGLIRFPPCARREAWPRARTARELSRASGLVHRARGSRHGDAARASRR